MNYDHATALTRGTPLLKKLEFLVSELGRWAAQNPGLVTLYAEFQLVQGELAAEKKPVQGRAEKAADFPQLGSPGPDRDNIREW